MGIYEGSDIYNNAAGIPGPAGPAGPAGDPGPPGPPGPAGASLPLNFIWLDTNGDDSNNGQSPGTPVQTLNIAYQRAMAAPGRPVIIAMDKGTYSFTLGQSTDPLAPQTWTRVSLFAPHAVIIFPNNSGPLYYVEMDLWQAKFKAREIQGPNKLVLKNFAANGPGRFTCEDYICPGFVDASIVFDNTGVNDSRIIVDIANFVCRFGGLLSPAGTQFLFQGNKDNFLKVLHAEYAAGAFVQVQATGIPADGARAYVELGKIINEAESATLFNLLATAAPAYLKAKVTSCEFKEQNQVIVRSDAAAGQYSHAHILAEFLAPIGVTPAPGPLLIQKTGPGEHSINITRPGQLQASINDRQPSTLINKLLAGSGISFTIDQPGDNERVRADISTTISGAPNGQQLYYVALNEQAGFIGTGGGVNSVPSNGSRGFLFISDRSYLITRMRIWLTQVSGQNMRLALYDLAGNRIAQTARFLPVVGLNEVMLLAPVSLAGGAAFYMSYWVQDTAGNDRFLLVTGTSITSTSPLMQRSDPNEAPAAMGSGLTNTAARPWLMISES
jgi:hypothetical protein